MRDTRVNVQLFVTRESPVMPDYTPSPTTSICDPEKDLEEWRSSETSDHSGDLGRYDSADTMHASPRTEPTRWSHNDAVTYARPDVQALIRAAVDEAQREERLLVMGCGPPGLMTQVRNSVAECMLMEGGPSLELHCEQFGW